MTAGGWALLGFLLLALGELIREATARNVGLAMVFGSALLALAVALGKHIGAIP